MCSQVGVDRRARRGEDGTGRKLADERAVDGAYASGGGCHVCGSGQIAQKSRENLMA